MFITKCDICAKRGKPAWTGKFYQAPAGWWIALMKGPFGGQRHACSAPCQAQLQHELRGWKESQIQWIEVDKNEKVRYNRERRLATIKRAHSRRLRLTAPESMELDGQKT